MTNVFCDVCGWAAADCICETDEGKHRRAEAISNARILRDAAARNILKRCEADGFHGNGDEPCGICADAARGVRAMRIDNPAEQRAAMAQEWRHERRGKLWALLDRWARAMFTSQTMAQEQLRLAIERLVFGCPACGGSGRILGDFGESLNPCPYCQGMDAISYPAHLQSQVQAIPCRYDADGQPYWRSSEDELVAAMRAEGERRGSHVSSDEEYRYLARAVMHVPRRHAMSRGAATGWLAPFMTRAQAEEAVKAAGESGAYRADALARVEERRFFRYLLRKLDDDRQTEAFRGGIRSALAHMNDPDRLSALWIEYRQAHRAKQEKAAADLLAAGDEMERDEQTPSVLSSEERIRLTHLWNLEGKLTHTQRVERDELQARMEGRS